MNDDRRNNSGRQGSERPSKREAWQEKKLEKAKRDDIDVISRRTMDQGDFIGLLNNLDHVLYQLRMNMGRNTTIRFDKAQEFIERSQQIKEDINLLIAEMFQVMGYEYKPPRGFKNPFAVTEEKEKVKKGPGSRSPAADNIPEAVPAA